MMAIIAAEWRKNRRRPALLIAGAALLAVTAFAYAINYYEAWHPSPQQLAEAPYMRLQLYPRELVNNLVGSAFPLGGAVALVLGALVGGSDFAWGTLKTAMTQGPSRLSIAVGRLTAYVAWLFVLTVLLFAVGALCSLWAAMADHHAVQLFAAADLAKGVLAMWLVLAVYGAIGVLLGTLFRQAAAGVGVGLIYLVILQGVVLQFLASHSGLTWLADSLDARNANSLLQTFTDPAAFPDARHPAVTAFHAMIVLLAFFAVAAAACCGLLWKRDVT
jgi:ABC-2 type transport system permease protein